MDDDKVERLLTAVIKLSEICINQTVEKKEYWVFLAAINILVIEAELEVS